MYLDALVNRRHTMLAIGFVLAAGACTSTETFTLPPLSVPGTASPPLSTPTQSPKATSSPQSRQSGEAVVTIPNVGTLSWRCAHQPGSEYRFATTFTSEGATDRVSYSLEGGGHEIRTLQPGQAFATPFTTSTSHSWHVTQGIEPYTTRLTISALFTRNSFGDCLNPEIDVSRIRKSHVAP